jgi:hypothetical protein
VLFDDARIGASTDEDVGREVPFDLLARALAATDTLPKLLVLNACDSLEGAEVLLESVPVVVGMSSAVSDLAASVFAARFYSAIASAQSIGAALKQGSVAVEAAGLDEGWTPDALGREDIDLDSLLLVRPPDSPR